MVSGVAALTGAVTEAAAGPSFADGEESLGATAADFVAADDAVVGALCGESQSAHATASAMPNAYLTTPSAG
jgi:hypothetical protein